MPLMNQFLQNLEKENYIHHLKTIFEGADLGDIQSISKYNKGIRFLLDVIDIFSKYACCISLKDKKGIAVVNAFQKILNYSKRKPNEIWVDKRKELFNILIKSWLQDNNIEMYSTHNEGESAVA